MKKIILSVVLSLLVACAASAALLKEDEAICATGSGVVQVEPDTASVRLGVEVVKKTAQEAQADNALVMKKIISSITSLNIAKEKIQTSGFYIYPEVKYEQNMPPKTVGYRCSNQVAISVDDLTKVSRIIDAGVAAGANSVQGIQFFRKDDTESKKLALDKAVKEAAVKAQAIANAAGLKIKGVKSIIESGASFPIGLTDFNGARGMSAGAADTPVSPGLIEVRGNVTIIYKVE